MYFIQVPIVQRNATYTEGSCCRRKRGTYRELFNHETESNEIRTNANNEVHVRRNLLTKSEDLLRKNFEISSNEGIQEVPEFSSLKKNQRNRYFKEHQISSEYDFVKYILFR